jgi:hypothetical protein
METEGHVKNNACAVEIKIKWMIRKDMTHENTYRDDTDYSTWEPVPIPDFISYPIGNRCKL